MKFLPLHFREKSAEFDGKHGINWHVTAVIRKTPESCLSVEVFVHAFDSCDQDQMESNGGVKGCRVSVVEMPQRSSQIDTNVKIKEISHIHNICYEEGGIRFWKAFDLGKGKCVVQDNMPSAEIPKVKVVQAFLEACLSSGTMARSSKHTEEEKATPTDTENVGSDALSALLTGALALLILNQSSRGT